MKRSEVFNRILIEILSLAGWLLASFLKEPLPDIRQKPSNREKIPVGPGPEDFVVDRWHAHPRLLISCYDRRNRPANGEIHFYDMVSGDAGIFPRTGEPGRMVCFKPHGADIRRVSGETLFYVILHDPYGHGRRSENAVGVYRVLSDRLQLVDFLEDPDCLWSPNNLSVLDSGEIYLTNDARGKRDLFLMRSISEIVRYQPQTGKWHRAAGGIGFANGIAACSNRVYVAASYGNRLISYPRYPDGRLGPGHTVVPLKGGDNLTRNGEMLLVAAHYDYMAFLRHSRSAARPSPSVILQIDPESRSRTPVYVDSGETISAATTARIYRNRLYISQAFDPFLLACDIP